MLDAFLNEFGLHNDEGVALMCLAESLLRVPDSQTADELIADKLGPAHWDEHLGHSSSLLVNASTWATDAHRKGGVHEPFRGARPAAPCCNRWSAGWASR